MSAKYTPKGIEDKIDELDSKMSLVLENHLPHLQENIVALKTRINIMTGINIGGIIIGIIIAHILK